MAPINCPNGGEAKYRFTKEHRRIAICPGGKVVENVKFKKGKGGKLVKAAKRAKSLGK